MPWKELGSQHCNANKKYVIFVLEDQKKKDRRGSGGTWRGERLRKRDLRREQPGIEDESSCVFVSVYLLVVFSLIEIINNRRRWW